MEPSKELIEAFKAKFNWTLNHPHKDELLSFIAQREALAMSDENLRAANILSNEKGNNRCSSHRVFRHYCTACAALVDHNGEIDRLIGLLAH